MVSLLCTLLADGPTDNALEPILERAIAENLSLVVANVCFADLRGLSKPPGSPAERIQCAIEIIKTVSPDAKSVPVEILVAVAT